MKSPYTPGSRQRGVTLIELMVTLAITLFLVAAAAYMYLGTRESQRAIERNSSNVETGTFALQLIGDDLKMAGFYPATISRPLTTDEPYRKLASYPPVKLAENAATLTDWVSPHAVYLAGIYGCDGAKFLPRTGTCDTKVDTAPDSIVINYFTNDIESMATKSSTGQRRDCTGSDVKNDPTNDNRVNKANPLAAPLQPLLVSNRYWLNATNTEIDKQAITTLSLACSGNGNAGSAMGGSTSNTLSQPLLAGIEDMQFTYGVFAQTIDNGSRTPDGYFTADQMKDSSIVPTVSVDNGIAVVPLSSWSRVVAVRVCIMTKSIGASPKIADNTGALRTYIDCKGDSQTQAASDMSLRKRFVQIFPVRNMLNQVF